MVIQIAATSDAILRYSISCQAKKIIQYGEPHLPAFLRVKLAAENIVPADSSSHPYASIEAVGDTMIGVSWCSHVGMNKIDRFAQLDPMQDCTFPAFASRRQDQGIPTDIWNVFPASIRGAFLSQNHKL